MISDDWTIGPDGRSNTSDQYNAICAAVEQLILNEGRTLLLGQTRAMANLIVSHLAHIYGMKPTKTP